MGRRTSGQTVGQEKIGNVTAEGSTLTSTQTDQDIIFDPNGTGITKINRSLLLIGNGSVGGGVRLGDADGSHYTELRTADSTTTNRVITFPNTTGGANQILQTDGSGNLSWVAQTTAGISSSDPGSSGTTHYPLFATSSGNIPTGQVTAFNAKTNLSFIPSTGELSSTLGRFANVVGSAANSGTVTIRGTSSATKATASVLLTDGVTSSSTATGTLVVTGGVGISGATFTNTLNVGSTSTFTGEGSFSAGLVAASGSTIRARYSSDNSYAANLSWNVLQLGNNGNNEIVAGNTATGGSFRFWVNSNTLASAGTWSSSGINALSLASNGNATFSGTITENSSIAYKENVNPIMDALSKILMLNGVTYDCTEGSDNKGEAGLIAEQVYEVLPNLVQLKDGKPDGVCYNRLTAYLIEAVKTLSAEVEKLKK
jgi:hypothetical protein